MLSVILVEIEPKEEQRVCDELRLHSEIKKAHLTDGEFDALLIVEGESPEAIGRFNFDVLRRIRGIEHTTVELIQPHKLEVNA